MGSKAKGSKAKSSKPIDALSDSMLILRTSNGVSGMVDTYRRKLKQTDAGGSCRLSRHPHRDRRAWRAHHRTASWGGVLTRAISGRPNANDDDACERRHQGGRDGHPRVQGQPGEAEAAKEGPREADKGGQGLRGAYSSLRRRASTSDGARHARTHARTHSPPPSVIDVHSKTLPHARSEILPRRRRSVCEKVPNARGRDLHALRRGQGEARARHPAPRSGFLLPSPVQAMGRQLHVGALQTRVIAMRGRAGCSEGKAIARAGKDRGSRSVCTYAVMCACVVPNNPSGVCNRS